MLAELDEGVDPISVVVVCCCSVSSEVAEVVGTSEVVDASDTTSPSPAPQAPRTRENPRQTAIRHRKKPRKRVGRSLKGMAVN